MICLFLCFLLLASRFRDRLNPLRVGLWSGSLIRREWLSLQDSYQWV
uniref:Uncharacterized protein n=1 Tax=Arundo donax TaxID=35708 RepID=A0A0A9H3F0_ARUDO